MICHTPIGKIIVKKKKKKKDRPWSKYFLATMYEMESAMSNVS